MNYKMLVPTFRRRYRFIRDNLIRFVDPEKTGKGLNLGTGEGDYDPMLARYCRQLIACDINAADIEFARQLNSDVPNLEYRVEDALALSFPDNTFDLLVSVEVIEHVGRPERMMDEIARVLRPNGLALVTFPSLDFPFTYDPVNRLLRFFGNRKISQGAYAFGHEYLIDPVAFRQWARDRNLEIVAEESLSCYLVGFLEMYWTGWAQRTFKINADNLEDQKAKKIALRPTKKEPLLTKLTDALINLDHALFHRLRPSVGRGFVLRKPMPR